MKNLDKILKFMFVTHSQIILIKTYKDIVCGLYEVF